METCSVRCREWGKWVENPGKLLSKGSKSEMELQMLQLIILNLVVKTTSVLKQKMALKEKLCKLQEERKRHWEVTTLKVRGMHDH